MKLSFIYRDMEAMVGFLLNINSLFPDILWLPLALPSVYASQIFYPESVFHYFFISVVYYTFKYQLCKLF